MKRAIVLSAIMMLMLAEIVVAAPSKDAGDRCFEYLYKRYPPSNVPYQPYELRKIKETQYYAATIYKYTNWGQGKKITISSAWSKKDFDEAEYTACRRALNYMRRNADFFGVIR